MIKNVVEIWEGDLNNMNNQGEICCEIYFGNKLVGMCWLELSASLVGLTTEVKNYLINDSKNYLAELPFLFSWIPTAHCWQEKCNRALINRLRTVDDEVYGHYCPNCQQSLRFHPFFGEEKEYDIGNYSCRVAWGRLSNREKAAVYARYRFPVPKRLVA